jgi:hypothetical protein
MQEALLHRTATQHPPTTTTIHHPSIFYPPSTIHHQPSTIIHHSLITDHHCILHSFTTATPTNSSITGTTPFTIHQTTPLFSRLLFLSSIIHHGRIPYKHIYTSTHIVLLIRSKLSNSRFMLFPMHLSDTRHQKIDSPSSPFTDVFLL